MKMKLIRMGLYLMAGFYLIGGLNHFLNPSFYLPLIPEYFPEKEFINYLAGIFEISFSICLLLKRFRKIASYGIIAMLIAFIPSHIYFIQINACVPDGLCTPLWVAWVRLLIIHPLLMMWAWIYRDLE
ncbi:MAG: hypothetical protein HWE15_07685 [Algoriphagus sp.]|uniref:DoxX family protein n=1 Tax=Algoriphagus sp. TaxID=1872435 RepID=UPI00182DA971|nr:hypothetical protein [Algoriphagus sp.]NVJ86172.1 hypothetical protein [Algoriphagus sp.]